MNVQVRADESDANAFPMRAWLPVDRCAQRRCGAGYDSFDQRTEPALQHGVIAVQIVQLKRHDSERGIQRSGNLLWRVELESALDLREAGIECVNCGSRFLLVLDDRRQHELLDP